MTEKTQTMLAVALSCAKTKETFEAKVALSDGTTIEEAHEPEVIIGIVQAAAEQFKHHLATTGHANVDAQAFLLENICVAPEDGQIASRYLVNGCYSDYPEGGTWSDHVHAISLEDAELQARFIMACNETDIGRTLTVKEFISRAASYMEEEAITDVEPDPLTKAEMTQLLEKFVGAGKKMIARYGNCGTPAQQEAANEMAASIRAGEEALAALKAAA